MGVRGVGGFFVHWVPLVSRCCRPHAQMASSTGTIVIPYSEIEYLTHAGTLFSSWRSNIPSCTNSCRCRISIRSVISGMLRRSSLVRMGPSSSLHRIVPFQRPSITDSIASIGQGEISFFETGMVVSWLHFCTDNFVTTTFCISGSSVSVYSPKQ
jgi:hypothetical protein